MFARSCEEGGPTGKAGPFIAKVRATRFDLRTAHRISLVQSL